MDSKTTGIVAYLTLIGLIIAFVAGDKESELGKFHVNQALVLFLFALLSVIPIIGQIWAIFIFVCWIIGFVGACKGEMNEVPLIGKIKIIK